MKIFERIFRKKTEPDIPPMPSWEIIIEKMYDKQLDSYADQVVNVIYSKDKSMRYVIFKDERGVFNYRLEAIYKFDEEEWEYFRLYHCALPAMWEPFRGIVGISVFENTEELMKEMKEEAEYKNYFE